jgi:hypothetical protein
VSLRAGPDYGRAEGNPSLSRQLNFGFSVCSQSFVDHSERAVYGMMNCLRSLENWDRGFESHSRHGCLCVRLFCVCVILCEGSGLETGCSLLQVVLPSVKKRL